MGLQSLAAGAVVDAAQHRRGPVPHLGRPGALVPHPGPGRGRRYPRGLVVAIVVRMAGATGEKKERAEALLAYQALHDMLTGLPNRAFFYERTEEALARRAVDGSISAVMLFDLDRFKEINDTMGHKYGDRCSSRSGPG